MLLQVVDPEMSFDGCPSEVRSSWCQFTTPIHHASTDFYRSSWSLWRLAVGIPHLIQHKCDAVCVDVGAVQAAVAVHAAALGGALVEEDDSLADVQRFVVLGDYVQACSCVVVAVVEVVAVMGGRGWWRQRWWWLLAAGSCDQPATTGPLPPLEPPASAILKITASKLENFSLSLTSGVRVGAGLQYDQRAVASVGVLAVRVPRRHVVDVQ